LEEKKKKREKGEKTQFFEKNKLHFRPTFVPFTRSSAKGREEKKKKEKLSLSLSLSLYCEKRGIPRAKQ